MLLLDCLWLLCLNMNSVLMLFWFRLLHFYVHDLIFGRSIVHSFVDKLINLLWVLWFEVNLELALGLRLLINIKVKVMLFNSWLLLEINIQVMLSLVRLIFQINIDYMLLLGSVGMLDIHSYLVHFLLSIRLFKVEADFVFRVRDGLFDIEIDLMLLDLAFRLLNIHVHIMILLFRILLNFDLEDLLGLWVDWIVDVDVDSRRRRGRLLLNLGSDNLVGQLGLFNVKVDDSLRRIGLRVHINIDGLVGENLWLWHLYLEIDIRW